MLKYFFSIEVCKTLQKLVLLYSKNQFLIFENYVLIYLLFKKMINFRTFGMGRKSFWVL